MHLITHDFDYYENLLFNTLPDPNNTMRLIAFAKFYYTSFAYPDSDKQKRLALLLDQVILAGNIDGVNVLLTAHVYYGSEDYIDYNRSLATDTKHASLDIFLLVFEHYLTSDVFHETEAHFPTLLKLASRNSNREVFEVIRYVFLMAVNVTLSIYYPKNSKRKPTKLENYIVS